MKIKILFRKKDTSKLTKEKINEILKTKLKRFKNVFKNITLVFSDVNGPRGGIDKLCTLSIKTYYNTLVTIKTVEANEMKSLREAMNKAYRQLLPSR